MASFPAPAKVPKLLSVLSQLSVADNPISNIQCRSIALDTDQPGKHPQVKRAHRGIRLMAKLITSRGLLFAAEGIKQINAGGEKDEVVVSMNHLRIICDATCNFIS